MKGVRVVGTVALLAALSGAVIHDAAFLNAQGDRVDGRVLGKAYAVELVNGLADGWTAAAEAVEGGKSVAEAQAVLQERWRASRREAFARRVAPEFARVLPEGREPDANQRAAVGRLWREFAEGVKGER